VKTWLRAPPISSKKGRVVQISGKGVKNASSLRAFPRADAPPQEWGLNGVAIVTIETIGH
jgi:hypothetical protein